MRQFKLLLLVLAIFWYGCGESIYAPALRFAPPVPYFTFSLSFQPKVYLRPDTNTVLVINKVDLCKKPLAPLDMETAKAGAYTALKYAGDQLALVPHIRVINLTDSLNFTFNTDSIATLAARYHADYTLALVKYEGTVAFATSYRNREYYDNEVDLKFVMYLGKGVLYKELRGSDTLRSVRRERDSIATTLNHASGDANKDFILAATQDAVFKALADYLPYTETENRPLYAGAKLGPAADAIMKGQFDKAAQLTQPLLNDRDPVVACQAAYNLAVVYEAQGNLDRAMEMAQQALAKSKSLYASSLVVYLKSK